MKPTCRTNVGPLDEDKWENLLEIHIPDRLREIAWCAKMAERVITAGAPLHISLAIDGKPFCDTSCSNWLVHPAYDTGIIMCRVMMEFLGIRYDPAGFVGKSEPYGDRKDDVCLLDFAIPFISVAEANAGAASIALHETLLAANKGIGHLTRTRGGDLKPRDLKDASEYVISLVGCHLYDRLGKTRPDFSSEIQFA
jgi:hypothetical protein